MGAAIFKAGGMAAVLAAGGLALLQAGVRVEGTLAAAPAPPAVPARDADPFGEPLGEPFGGSLDDSTFGEAPFGDPSFAAPPSDEPASGAAGLDDPGFDAWDADPTAAPRPAAPRPAAPVADEEPGDATDWGDERWDMLPPADPTFLPSADDAAFPADRDLTREEPAFGEPPAGPERFRAGDTAVPPTAAAALRVTKDVPAEVAPGQPLVYTITVFNAGNGPARGVSVEEPIPAGTQLEGTNPIADLAGRTLRWNLPELPPGGEETLHVRVVPRGPGTVGSVTVVRCEVEAAGRTRVLAAKLAVTARVAGTPRAGGTFDLIHRLENRGTADAAGVVLRTVLPAGATHASGERDLEYDVGPLPAGDSREITLTLAAADTGPLRIDCEVTGAGVEPVSAAADLAVQPRQLTLTRTGPRTRFVGRHGVYENVVTNVSGEPAPPVRVVEAVPVGMTFERAAAGGRYDAESRTVAWDVAPLRPGASATLSVDLIADDPGEVESRVRLERDGRIDCGTGLRHRRPRVRRDRPADAGAERPAGGGRAGRADRHAREYRHRGRRRPRRRPLPAALRAGGGGPRRPDAFPHPDRPAADARRSGAAGRVGLRRGGRRGRRRRRRDRGTLRHRRPPLAAARPHRAGPRLRRMTAPPVRGRPSPLPSPLLLLPSPCPASPASPPRGCASSSPRRWGTWSRRCRCCPCCGGGSRTRGSAG